MVKYCMYMVHFSSYVFFLYFKTFTKTDVYITVDAFIILTLERGRSKKRKNASIINIIFVQVNNFQKVSFVPHFIKEFERKFYTTAVLLYRIFQLFLHVSKSQYFFPIRILICSNLLDIGNLQEQLKKHSVTKNCSDLSLFE